MDLLMRFVKFDFLASLKFENILKNPRFLSAALVFLILTVYLPFSFEPILRPTGDDKVYIAQVVEMVRDGRWTNQTLADQPNYYKGPLLYVLLKVSMLSLSVQSTFATLMPNIISLILSSILMFTFLVRERQDSAYPGAIAFVTTASVALSFGLYPFIFAAQMEALLTAVFVLVTILMIRGIRHHQYLLAWMAIGASGLIKSPVHSVLCGLAFLVAVPLMGHGRALIRKRFWLAAAAGVAVGVGGYLPALFFDFDNFWTTYVLRETADKVGNGVSIWSAVLPALTYFQFPFGLFVWAGVWSGMKPSFSGMQAFIQKHAVELSLLAINLLFFALHPYRSEIYCLPVIAPALLMAGRSFEPNAFVLKNSKSIMQRILFGAGIGVFGVHAFLLVVLCLGAMLGMLHFDDNLSQPTQVAGAAVFLSLPILIYFLRQRTIVAISGAIVATLPIYLCTGFLLRDLGRWDLKELRAAAETSAEFGFWNLDRRTWSEWGAMNPWLARSVTGYHTEKALIEALRRGATVYAPHVDALASVKKTANAFGMKCCLEIKRIERFRIAGGGKGIDWRKVFLDNEWRRVTADGYVVNYLPAATPKLGLLPM
jgi:hypothetical protein